MWSVSSFLLHSPLRAHNSLQITSQREAEELRRQLWEEKARREKLEQRLSDQVGAPFASPVFPASYYAGAPSLIMFMKKRTADGFSPVS